MKTLESIIKGRRSVRKFKSGEIDQGTLEKLVELALWAPSSCNRQTIHIRFVGKTELIKKVAQAAFDQPILHQSITLAVVCVDLGKYRNVTLKDNLAPYLDAGLAMQNFLLAASELEIGSCTIAGRLNQEHIRKVLNLPRSWMIAAFIALGIPDEQPPSPERNHVELHVSYDDMAIPSQEASYGDYIALRRRWARAGFNITWAYRRPKEGLPIFRHAFSELKRRLSKSERVLVTNTVMGEYLFDDENVEHLAASDDEIWYLADFLSAKAKLIRSNLADTDVTIAENTYDRIVSPFDVHFLGQEDRAVFAKNISRCLKPQGVFTVICINSRSLWGLNHRLAMLFRRDVTGLRYFGYESPVSPGEIVDNFDTWFSVDKIKTVSFFPPPNIWYLMSRMRLIPLEVVRPFDVLGSVPILRNFGNVAFIDLKLKNR